jgi:hypothetical protein
MDYKTYKLDDHWKNITYPLFLGNFIWLWKRTLCKTGFHLFDEVFSAWDEGRHYLVCDACELTVIMDDEPTHSHEYQLNQLKEAREAREARNAKNSN